MDGLPKEEMITLLGPHEEPCVSIYFPTHRTAKEARQDPIRFKNLQKKAEERLNQWGMRALEAKAFLQPAQQLLPDTLFWQYQSDGLAVFLSRNTFRHYRLPLRFQELVVVSHRFHIKPLLPLFNGDDQFYVLALSQNEVRLFQGTSYAIREVDLEGIPRNLAEALPFDVPDKQLQFHTQTPRGMGRRAAVFHGQGVGVDDRKDKLLRYFYQIAGGIDQRLKEERAPLVLAGVEYLFPLYQEANTYPYLVPEGITGNPEELSPAELHARAIPIVQPHLRAKEQAAIAQYRQMAGRPRASKDIEEIAVAAHDRKIELAFVASTLELWGRFDPGRKSVSLHPAPKAGAEGLLDFMAAQTLLHGGQVFAVPPDRVPDGPPLAAVFRF